MHRNNLLLPILSLLVVTYATPDERRKFVRVITEPKPGEEYVSIHAGKPSSNVQEKHAESGMHVNIQDEGQTGVQEVAGFVPTEEKLYAHKKVYPTTDEEPKRPKPEKKYSQIADEIIPARFVAKSNDKLKNKREEGIETFSKSTSNKEDEGLYDFVDSPFGGQIVGSASSQASRINIKKAPNGQEYEYEYVYYYYDEDEENAKPGSKTSQNAPSSTPASQQTNLKNNKDTKENNKTKKPTVQTESHFVQNNNKGRFSTVEPTITSDEPEGHANFAVNDISEHNSKTKESARNLEEALSVPSSSSAVSEERLPHNPRFPARSRGGNSKPSQEFATTVIPATDTPITRIRTNGLDLVDSSAFRTSLRNNKDAVVQTTPADQVATIINNAYNTQLTETVASVTETVSLDRDQAVTDVDTKGLSLTTTLTPDEVVTVTQHYTAGSTDKGAVDLYAILQQARSEETGNAISSSLHTTTFDDGDTPFSTTLRLAPTTAATTTTTTTTTTPAPTTTTTTTTTAAPPPPPPATRTGPLRTRFRGNNAGGNRSGPPPASTTTTSAPTESTPPPSSEEATEKRRFKPSRERNTQGSVYSKRYQSSTAALDKESSTIETEVSTKAQRPSFGRQRTRASKPVSSTIPIDENVEVTSAAPKPNFAERSNLRRQNSRNKFTTSSATTTSTTAAPHVSEEEESNAAEHEVSEPPTSTTTKYVGNKLRPNIRPLRPGLRLNFGGKGSSTSTTPVTSTTQASISESSFPDETEEKEKVQEPSPTPAPDTLSRFKNKSRFRVPEKQASFAPKQQTLAPPVNGQNRKNLLSNLLPKKKSIQTEEPPVVEDVKLVLENEQENEQTPEVQNEEAEQQQPSSTTTSTTEAPTSSTNRLSSLLAKRRPLQRRPAELSSKQSNQEE